MLLDTNLSKANLKGVNLREAYLFETHAEYGPRGSKLVHTHSEGDIVLCLL
jgi:uncharacterized protein YjbI with pentapeptide repeats